MCYKQDAQEKFVTHRSYFMKYDQEQGIVEVLVDEGPEEGSEQKLVKVSAKEFFEINQPHEFASDETGKLQFEDGLRCNYKSSRVRAKLLEAAIAVEPLVA